MSEFTQADVDALDMMTQELRMAGTLLANARSLALGIGERALAHTAAPRYDELTALVELLEALENRAAGGANVVQKNLTALDLGGA